MELYYREYGSPRTDRPCLIFLHGLFGSSINWHSIARKFEDEWHIVIPDLRNHGRSPHSESMDYIVMAEDVHDLLDTLEIDQAILIGHSMGGKTAMLLAMNQTDLVRALIVVDIAPVAYAHEFDGILAGFTAVDLDSIANRSEADAMMAEKISHPGIRQYLLQNLSRDEGAWRWRLNLPVIDRCMDEIKGFPGCHEKAYAGPTLILRGERSDYVLSEHKPVINACLSRVSLETIPGVGHWVYAEAPEAFVSAINRFLGQLN